MQSRRISSSIQYWLYAVLAKRFGDSVKLSRTSVSYMYEVNRHDFEAKASYECEEDAFEFAAGIYRFIVDHLVGAGYRSDKYSGYTKALTIKGERYEVCITVRYEPEFYNVKNDTVSLSVSMHKLYA